MTQNEAVLEYMREHGSITPQEAVNALGCFRLSARIYDLREQGYLIRTENKRFKSRSGKGGYYAEYSFGDPNGEDFPFDKLQGEDDE